MKRILFLGSSFGILKIIEYAKSKGYYTIVTDYLDISRSRAKQVADEAWNISTSEIDVLERKCREYDVKAVLCGISEFNLDVLIELTGRLGLPCYCSKKQRGQSKDKRLFKRLCRELRIPVPEDYNVAELNAGSFINGLEVVVKPSDCAGSEGVTFCSDYSGLTEALKLASEKSTSGNVIIERRLIGREFFAVYCFANDSISLVTLNEMHSQKGFPTKCYSLVTSSNKYIKRFCNEIDPQIRYMFKHIGYKRGCAWVQTILDADDSFYLLEMGAEYRLPDMFPVNGFNYAEWLFNEALGEGNNAFNNSVKKICENKAIACEYLFWTCKADIIKRIIVLPELSNQGIDVEMLVKENESVEAFRIIGHALFYVADTNAINNLLYKINNGIKVIGSNDESIIIPYEVL